jgi:protein-S-isoprenylcysteine O-methyltransferase Ste14
MRILLLIVVIACILFPAAGRIDWPAAWLLIILYLVYLLGVMIWGFKNAPDLLQERGRIASNVKTWDKLINAVYAIFLVILLIVAALDAVRFGWSKMALGFQAAGIAGLVASGWFIWRVIAENAYASRWARIQADRGQVVVTSGPYRFVRHPMYAAIILLVASLALALGSWWGLVPGGAIAVLFFIRTGMEDRMLQEELPGYREYARRVRFRLFPGIW